MNRTCPKCGRTGHMVLGIYEDKPEPFIRCFCLGPDCMFAWPEPVGDWRTAS